jgi:Plasmid pRiA4b ORF-3-like protein
MPDPWGYHDLLEAIADPNHQEHAERLERIGHDFDPRNTDVEALTQAVRGLAKKSSRRSSSCKRA